MSGANSKIRAIDLFCGAGGLTHGFLRAGIEVVAGIDNAEICRYAYESNNQPAKFLCKGVEDVTAAELKKLWGKGAVRLLAGCAPCQPFSTYSLARNPQEDDRFPLLSHFERLVRETLPELVTMENVPNVALYSVFERFQKTLTDLGYVIWSDVVDCLTLGIPQQRKRMVLMASRLSKGIPSIHIPNGNLAQTVRTALEGLPKLAAGKADSSDRLHRCAGLSSLNIKRIRKSHPGGTWRDWPEKLRLECHRRDTGKGYASVYGRMIWDEPAPTMTTQCFNYGSGRFGHPEENRAISLREAAIFQSFPRNYQFDSADRPISITKLGRMIGNAVPVNLGKAVGDGFISLIS